jgi:hypothetical protein
MGTLRFVRVLFWTVCSTLLTINIHTREDNKMEIDEWIGITTPKGEEIDVNIFSTDDTNQIGIHFYDIKTFSDGSRQVGECFNSIMVDTKEERIIK